jgi:hypothetical protein
MRTCGLGVAALLAWGAFASAHAGGLAIVGTELRDNGDHDGYADTNETVELWLTVRNTTTTSLTGVTAQISIASGNTVCLVDDSAAVGDLAPGQQARALEPLVFHVKSTQDRGTLGLSPYGTLTAAFDLAFAASPTAPAAFPSELTFDLDLDVAAAVPTTVTENFESGGFGLFSVQNLDFGLHTGDGETGPVVGYRCQYHEAYCDHASCDFSDSLPGATAASANAVWWRIDGPSMPGGGRCFSGSRALYFGEALGPPFGYTTPTGVLEAVATTDPIHIAAGRWCSNAATTACLHDAGCPAGGSCVDMPPTLSFMQQMSFMDYRSIGNTEPGTCLDRGVVSLQLADSSGAPVGPWVRLEPSINVHDQTPTAVFNNATFDPIDDGNTGNDLFPPFDPADGLLRRGPSSTCADERVFAWMGSTTGAFDPLATGGADGPGLAGATGPGTWVETSYDLSRYRGRSIRIRFLASTTRIGSAVTWKDLWGSNVPWDDGWWIDDVTIGGATSSAGLVANDTHDNSSLTVDADLDGVDDLCEDNCLGTPNPSQADLDADGVGDACDTCTDGDADGLGNPGFPASTCALDNCPLVSNPSQTDSDLDGEGDPCDACPTIPDAGADADADGAGDVCDCAPSNPQTYPGAPEVNDGLDNQCAGDQGFGPVDEIQTLVIQGSNVSWAPQPLAISYTIGTRRGTRYTSTVSCGTTTYFEAQGSVSTAPPTGQTIFILVRARTPHVGSWGRSSSGVERTVPCASPP